ncbi:MAG: hypothetical protein AAF761_09040 [Pseudomonadota bacterium]
MKHLIAVLALAGAFAAQPATTRAQDFIPGVFDTYEDLAEAMDSSIMAADITATLMRFDGGVTSEGEAIDVQRQFTNLFPDGLPNAALVRQVKYSGGLSRELRMYWNRTKYLWVSVLIHDQGDRVVAIEFSTNTDYDTIAGEF